jgi:DNA topoisomerase IB
MDPEQISRFITENISHHNGLLFEDEDLIFEADDVEFTEPLGRFTFEGEEFPYWGNPEGRNRTMDYDMGKFNRYAKIGAIADQFLTEMNRTVAANPNSIEGRCAYASILMLRHGVRIGNEDSAEGYVSGMKQNKGEIVNTYGTTTLLSDHISTEGGLTLHFLGKEQVSHNIKISDPTLIKYGTWYKQHSQPHEKWLGIDYDMLFDFVKQRLGEGFIPKDLRTFCGNITGWREIQKYLSKPQIDVKSDAKKEVKAVVEAVAARLGNTPGIAKRAYLDNRMLDWFLAQRWVGNKESD